MILNRTAFVLAILLMSFTIGLGVTPNQANAQSAAQLLKAMEGKYRGRGTAEVRPGQPAEPVSCQVTNRYDSGANALIVEGSCASTQGKTRVDGRVTHDGNSVSGSLITVVDGSTVTKSTGEMKGGKLRVFTNLSNNVTKRLTRTLQVISLAGQGYRTDFYVFKSDKGTFAKTGDMQFTRTN